MDHKAATKAAKSSRMGIDQVCNTLTAKGQMSLQCRIFEILKTHFF